MPLADIITPNLFELSVLSDSQIRNYDDIITACKKLISKTGNHNQIIIVTSVSFSKDKTGIAIYHHGNFSYLESPKYKVQPKVSGSGDITAAMFLSYLLKGKNLDETLKAVTQCLDGIFRTTHQLNTDELALIQAQEYIR